MNQFYSAIGVRFQRVHLFIVRSVDYKPFSLHAVRCLEVERKVRMVAWRTSASEQSQPAPNTEHVVYSNAVIVLRVVTGQGTRRIGSECQPTSICRLSPAKSINIYVQKETKACFESHEKKQKASKARKRKTGR